MISGKDLRAILSAQAKLKEEALKAQEDKEE